MTSAERLRSHITTAYRTWNGRSVVAPLDIRAAFVEPEDLAYAKAEITRIRGARGHLTIFETDHESKIRCQTLERMVLEFEGGAT